MGWVKIEDRYPRHPKILEAGEAGLALDVCGMCYAREHNTDGFIPGAALGTLGPIRNPRKAADALVRSGRWSWDAELGGWWVHDYAEFNPSDEMDRAAAEARREKARKAARARWAKNDAQACSEQCSDDAASIDAVMPPSPPLPTASSSSSTTSEVAACSEDEEQFVEEIWTLLARRKMQLQRDAGKSIGNEVGWLATVAMNEREARWDEAVSLHRHYPTLGSGDVARVMAGESSILRNARRVDA